ncbi:MAG: nucleotidyltransferase family protein [Deltaproteobacteria bacterium]|nr:nucleotidyltransferase family protein [Deltaproteobacteria bacterium]
MKAMILAAGLGTRLRPLTSKKPKPLVPIGNRPLIDKLIHYLKGHGIREIVVNAHHHPQQIVEHLDGGRPFGIKVEVRVEPEILGTGGGIKNTEDFWDPDPFIVINGDILTDVDLNRAFEEHRRSGNLVTLVLHNYKPFNQIRIDNQQNIIDIASDDRSGRLAFTGIHIIEPEVLNYIPSGKFSNIIDCYRELIRSGEPIRAHLSHEHYWRDIGTVNSYVLANKESLHENSFLLAPDCRIHSTARMEEWAIIGTNVLLDKDVEIRRSILWNDVRVRRGTKVIDSVVTSQKDVENDLFDAIC